MKLRLESAGWFHERVQSGISTFHKARCGLVGMRLDPLTVLRVLGFLTKLLDRRSSPYHPSRCGQHRRQIG